MWENAIHFPLIFNYMPRLELLLFSELEQRDNVLGKYF